VPGAPVMRSQRRGPQACMECKHLI
jgi:hypothetical protein